MDFSNHLQGGESVAEKSDGLDGEDIGNLLMHYQTHFSMVVTSKKKKKGGVGNWENAHFKKCKVHLRLQMGIKRGTCHLNE